MANKSKPAYRFDTQKVRAGCEPKEHNNAVSPPIYQTAAYDSRDVEHAKALFGLRETGNLYTRKESPSHALYEWDFKNGAGGILSFGLKGSDEQRETFLNSAELFHYHVNIGDARSLIVNSPQTTHGELEAEEKGLADIPENLIRISAGLEDPADRIVDLERAFKRAIQ